MSHTYNDSKMRRERQRERRKWGESGEKMKEDEKRNEKKEKEKKEKQKGRKQNVLEKNGGCSGWMFFILERECPPSL